MPFYDYYCEDNGKTVEVFHSTKERCATWAEVCKKAKVDLGDTSGEAKVVRVLSNVTPMIFRVKGLDKDDYGDKLRV